VRRVLFAIIATALVLTMTAASVSAQAQAAQRYKLQVMEKLYSKILQSATVGTNTALDGSTILIMADLGIPLDPALHPETSQDDRRAISRLLDRVPGPSWVYRDMPYGLSQIYSSVLEYHELPTMSMTKQQKKDLKTANEVLFRNGNPAKGYSVKLTAYKNYQISYRNRVAIAEGHRGPDGTIPQDYAQAIQTALQDWKNKGYKDVVESALAKRNGLVSADPNLWFQDLSNTYSAAEESPDTPDQFEPVSLLPSYSSWSTLSWTPISLSGSDIQNLQTTSQIHNFQPADAAGIGAAVEFQGIIGGAIHTDLESQAHANGPIMSIKAEVLRVYLDRPWLDDLVFRSKIWRWSHAAPLASTLISDGATPPGSAFHDILMPYVPTSILVARNVQITVPISDSDQQQLRQGLAAKISVSVGPFTVGGSYQKDSTKATANSTVSNNGVSIPGYQIIGWYCEVLPKSPDPDLQDYKWPPTSP
jgi:hypothetical protein